MQNLLLFVLYAQISQVFGLIFFSPLGEWLWGKQRLQEANKIKQLRHLKVINLLYSKYVYRLHIIYFLL